jgi:hypothetical protein
MLACDTACARAGYVLYIESAEAMDCLERIGAAIEAQLCGSFHYEYARRLGQLAPLRVCRVEGAADRYMARAVREGQRAGNVKPLALDRRTDWTDVLTQQRKGQDCSWP